MSRATIEKILAQRGPAGTSDVPQKEEEKFFSVLGADGLNEEFLELRTRNGDMTCFSYSDLNWFHWDAGENCIDLDFGSAMVVIRGRGLVPKLFHGLKSKRVAWVKEADAEMEDHDKNETFVSQISILPANLATDAEVES